MDGVPGVFKLTVKLTSLLEPVFLFFLSPQSVAMTMERWCWEAGPKFILLHWTARVYLKGIFVFAVVVIYTCEATPPFSFLCLLFLRKNLKIKSGTSVGQKKKDGFCKSCGRA